MTQKRVTLESKQPPNRSVQRWVLGSALGTALMAFVALGIAITTAPARSGPNCSLTLVDRCITYPYTDAAAYAPNDYWWMYPALLIGPLFVILVSAIGQSRAHDKQLFSQLAVAFAAMSATVLMIDYYVQLTVIQASFLKGEETALTLLSQYNPHGLFIALEDMGYLLMGIAFLFLALSFDRHTGLARAIRWHFFVSGLLIIGALVLLAMRYGSNLEYRFEVVSLLIAWLTLISCGILLSLYARKGVI